MSSGAEAGRKMWRWRPKLRHAVTGGIFLAGLAFFADGLWIKGKAVVAQAMLDHAFLASAERGSPQKPWAWADIKPFARISAPRIGAENVVLDNVSGEALAFGPGHLPDSAKPGEAGAAVFSAHRDTHFKWLGDLRKDDVVVVETADGNRRQYRIRRAWVAKYDAPGIDRHAPERLLVLTTCWPLDATLRSDWRFIVEGVEMEAGAADQAI